MELAIDLAASPAPFVARRQNGLEPGTLPAGERAGPAPDAVALAPLTDYRRQRAAVLLSLRECVVVKLPRPELDRRKVGAAVRYQVARMLKRSPDAVSVDWTETPTGALAAGMVTEVVAPLIAAVEGAGPRVAAVEPAILALLRAVCRRQEEVVMVLRLTGDGGELVVGSGWDVYLTRRFPWSMQAVEGLSMDVEDTLRAARECVGGESVSSVLLAGDADWTEVLARLGRKASVPVAMASLHPGWDGWQVPPTHLAAAGGLLDSATSRGATTSRRTVLPRLPFRRKQPA